MYRLLASVLLGVALIGASPVAALAATSSPADTVSQAQARSLTVPIVGTNGTNAVATITNLQLVNGVLTAVGTITGDVTTLVNGIPVTTHVVNAPFTAPLTFSGTCKILTLDLGPIHLDLLGLIVDVSAVHANVSAQSGPGNLLGNLLCSVAHLLDTNPTGTALQNLLDHLNRILAGV